MTKKSWEVVKLAAKSYQWGEARGGGGGGCRQGLLERSALLYSTEWRLGGPVQWTQHWQQPLQTMRHKHILPRIHTCTLYFISGITRAPQNALWTQNEQSEDYCTSCLAWVQLHRGRPLPNYCMLYNACKRDVAYCGPILIEQAWIACSVRTTRWT